MVAYTTWFADSLFQKQMSKRKRAPVSGPFFSFLLCRVGNSSNFVPFTRDSHRVRGVFSFVALLSPVESSILSGAHGAHTSLVRLWIAACKRFF